ncbi:MAG: hypothetical protein ACO1NS_05735 [Daejeonella sp.]
MKFKKIEISAFRIYDKVDDSTFNFTTEHGNIANFVSLYAPNGFGKTSFYDAVEWGITNNVQRFWQNEVITDKSINTLREITEKQISLLRNTNSLQDTKSFVKITTEQEELPPRQLLVHGNSKSDIQNKEICENEDFRKVILSQEWISAFLKEVNGERRYKIFAENPDLVEPDTYYKDIKGLLSLNNSRIEALKAEIDLEKRRIVEIGSENLLETINTSIGILIQQGEPLSPITLTTTDKDALDLKDRIALRLITINRTIDDLRLSIDKITIARTGDESNLGIDIYFEYLEKKVSIAKELTKIALTIKKFEELQDLRNELTNSTNQRSDDIASSETLKKILSNFPAFEIIAKNLKEKQELRNVENQNVLKIRELLNTLRLREKELQDQLNFNYSQVIDTENKIVNAPTLELGLDSLRLNVQKIDADIEEHKKSLESSTKDKRGTKEQFDLLTRIVADLSANNYNLITESYGNDLSNRITALIAKESELKLLRSRLQDLEESIENQKSFSSTIEEFAKLGLNIINDTTPEECPFCCSKFESYKALAEKVSNNRFLNSALQQLLKSKTEIQAQITELATATKKENESIAEIFIEQVNSHVERLTIIDGTITSAQIAIKNLESLKEDQKQKILELSKDLNGLSISEYQIKLDTTLNELKKQNNSLGRTLAGIEKELKAENEKEITAKTKVEMSENDIAQYSENSDYLEVHSWFHRNAPTEKIDIKVIHDLVAQLTQKIQIASDKILAVEQKTTSLEVELTASDLDKLKESLEEFSADRESIMKAISTYINFYEKEFKVDIAQFQKETVTALLNELELVSRERIQGLSGTIDEYLKLEKYSDNLVPFLQSENAKIKLKKKKKDLDFLKKTVLPHLENERVKVRAHLETKIKEFFYTDLINQIYNKIDPHPDFKAVQFKANFDADNPTLDVLVTDMENKQTLIPNLYFSSAQINILSLSIFLAAALNSKKYDCIFIDDPIQSMDSINVLSMIDLLRSIVINKNKQIILSTHDENFHNLLKKKIPSNLYDSKFMELETFGKVKADSVTA